MIDRDERLPRAASGSMLETRMLQKVATMFCYIQKVGGKLVVLDVQ